MNTHGERNVVVSGEDDELGSGVSNANITEDKRVIKGNSAGNWSGSISMSLSCKGPTYAAWPQATPPHSAQLDSCSICHSLTHASSTPIVWSCLPLLSI